jgi:hypothetical protein
MKTILISIALTLSSLTNAQSIIDKFFDKYSGTEGYTSVLISKYMFDMFRSESNQPVNNEQMDQVISKLTGIKILVNDDDPATAAPVNLYNEIMKIIPSSSYKEIMAVKEKDQSIKFYVMESKGKVIELLMVMGGKSQGLISIQGDIDMKNISKLAKGMEIQGMENLEKIK